MKFVTIENSEGSFTINIDDISGLMKYKAKESMMCGGPRSGEIFHNPERYMVETRNHKFVISEKKYKDILRMIAYEGV